MESRAVEVNGIHMRWEQQGEGRPAVFIHGIPTSPRLWRHVIPRVSGARSMAWEMVGYGDSIEEGEGRDISVVKQAEKLAYELGASMERIEGGKHFVPEDHPEPIAQAVNGLLEQIP